MRHHRGPCPAVRDPAQGPAVLGNINKALKKKEISRLINTVLPQVRSEGDRGVRRPLLRSGFRLARAPASPSRIDDMVNSSAKARFIARAEKVKEIEQQYLGSITAGERYNKVVDIWGKAGDEVGKGR